MCDIQALCDEHKIQNREFWIEVDEQYRDTSKGKWLMSSLATCDDFTMAVPIVFTNIKFDPDDLIKHKDFNTLLILKTPHLPWKLTTAIVKHPTFKWCQLQPIITQTKYREVDEESDDYDEENWYPSYNDYCIATALTKRKDFQWSVDRMFVHTIAWDWTRLFRRSDVPFDFRFWGVTQQYSYEDSRAPGDFYSAGSSDMSTMTRRYRNLYLSEILERRLPPVLSCIVVGYLFFIINNGNKTTMNGQLA